MYKIKRINNKNHESFCIGMDSEQVFYILNDHLYEYHTPVEEMKLMMFHNKQEALAEYKTIMEILERAVTVLRNEIKIAECDEEEEENYENY